MKSTMSPFLVRVWMPVLLIGFVLLLLHASASIVMWICSLPLLLVALFMTTLAEVRQDGHTFRVKWLWMSRDISQQDIAAIRDSFIEGIRVLQLRRSLLPWGRIYFVPEWADDEISDSRDHEESEAQNSRNLWSRRAVAKPIAIAIAITVSGVLAGRRANAVFGTFALKATGLHIAILMIAIGLCISSAIVRRRAPSFANLILFAAGFVFGCVRW